MRIGKEIASSGLGLPANSYVYSVHRYGASHIIATCSDRGLYMVDTSRLDAVSSSSGAEMGDITCSALAPASSSGDLSERVYVGTSTGRVLAWAPSQEPRKGDKALAFLETPGRAPVSSVAVSRSGMLAVGTELHNHSAAVAVYDPRMVGAGRDSTPVVVFGESHSDDVTELAWNDQASAGGSGGDGDRYLMSGGTDAVLNIYDTAVTDDPDEALVRSLNPGSSVSHAGFLPTGDGAREGIFSVSHDEQMTTWAVPVGGGGAKRYDDGEDDDLDDRVRAYGDLRPRLDCEYVVDVADYGAGAKVLGVGKHSQHRVDLYPLTYGVDLTAQSTEAIRLPGAHGEEIVRSFCIDSTSDLIYTCGEDGFVRTWKVQDESSKAGPERSKGKRDSKAHMFKHYKPY